MTEPCEPIHWDHPYATLPDDEERDVMTVGSVDDYQPQGEPT